MLTVLEVYLHWINSRGWRLKVNYETHSVNPVNFSMEFLTLKKNCFISTYVNLHLAEMSPIFS